MSHSAYTDCAEGYLKSYQPPQGDVRNGNGAPHLNGAAALSLPPAHALLISDHPPRRHGDLIEHLKEQQISLLTCTEFPEAKHIVAKYHPIAVLMDCAGD